MQLIVGSHRIIPDAIHRIQGGVEAVLQGAALLRVLDAAFHGAGSIEVFGGDLDRRPLDLVAIDMQGGTTKITLISNGPQPASH